MAFRTGEEEGAGVSELGSETPNTDEEQRPKASERETPTDSRRVRSPKAPTSAPCTGGRVWAAPGVGTPRPYIYH